MIIDEAVLQVGHGKLQRCQDLLETQTSCPPNFSVPDPLLELESSQAEDSLLQRLQMRDKPKR